MKGIAYVLIKEDEVMPALYVLYEDTKLPLDSLRMTDIAPLKWYNRVGGCTCKQFTRAYADQLEMRLPVEYLGGRPDELE